MKHPLSVIFAQFLKDHYGNRIWYHPYFSPEEYLETEKTSPIKHEYIQGKIYVMAGASDTHVTITANLLTLLRNHIRGSGCRVYIADMKVRIETLNIFYYPDLMVTCDSKFFSMPQ